MCVHLITDVCPECLRELLGTMSDPELVRKSREESESVLRGEE
jgi:hypothetical protein